ncbi:hypothetical protein HHI36_011173 [Cryptolaemus montrouzieri]|uniref:Uncharacterized protein n=1 Tax=Cryptolaemus montrouzieri TaxID=559131 RepID=A0ABD2MKY6_9CUCU
MSPLDSSRNKFVQLLTIEVNLLTKKSIGIYFLFETDKSCNENIMQPNLREPETSTSTSRKRLINKENWTVNKRTLLSNSGKEYCIEMGKKNAKFFENIDWGVLKRK